MSKANKRFLLAVLVLAAAITLLALLRNNVYISEYVFSRGISRWYIYAAGNAASLLPFPLYEILLSAAVISLLAVIVKTIRNLRKRQYGNALKKTLCTVTVILSIVLFYNVTASFCYYREPLDIIDYKEKPAKEEILAMAGYFMEDFNALSEKMQRDSEGNVIAPYGFKGLSEKIKSEFKRLPAGYFSTYIPDAKPMLFSEIMSYMGFSGIFMSLTGEPNINVSIPAMSLPAVTAHEMAHSAGVMREKDANLVSYYLLLTSDDDYLRYSGYVSTFNQMLAAVYYLNTEEEYNALYGLYSQKTLKEYRNASAYWDKYQSLFNGITEFFNDLYLKLSGIPEGVANYDNPYDLIDTGETDGDGQPVYDIVFSDVQKIYFMIYNGNV